MTDNQTNSEKNFIGLSADLSQGQNLRRNEDKNLDEKALWIERVKNLRAYLEQEQSENKAIYENYEKAQIELSNMIEIGNQLCLDLKAQYMEKVQSLNQEISHLQYHVNLEMQKLRGQVS
jgi:hypothetical protein